MHIIIVIEIVTIFCFPPVLLILYITSGNFLIYDFLTPPFPLFYQFSTWISHVTLARTKYNAGALFNVTPARHVRNETCCGKYRIFYLSIDLCTFYFVQLDIKVPFVYNSMVNFSATIISFLPLILINQHLGCNRLNALQVVIRNSRTI